MMEVNKPLVTIITPCHNSGKFIHRLFDSILSQTYSKVEMITVDNDSQDNTAEIINNYMPKFEEKGYSLSYYKQSDQGPSCAVRNVLSKVNGDYLYLPDSDDWINCDDFLDKMISKLESLPENYGMIRCLEQEILDGDLTKLGIIGLDYPEEDKSNPFEDCLLGHNNYYYPGVGYVYKVKALKATIRNLEIYGAYYIGQNRQLMMPILYSYKCYTLREVLVNYLVRKNSISHGDYKKYNLKKEIYKQEDAYISSILHSIIQMSEDDFSYYRNLYLFYSAEWMANMALANGKYSDSLKYYLDKKKHGRVGLLDYAKFLMLISEHILVNLKKKMK